MATTVAMATTFSARPLAPPLSDFLCEDGLRNQKLPGRPGVTKVGGAGAEGGRSPDAAPAAGRVGGRTRPEGGWARRGRRAGRKIVLQGTVFRFFILRA